MAIPACDRTSPFRELWIPGEPGAELTGDDLKSNYGLFNRNNIYIRSWSWNYRGCWHQTCPPIGTQQCF
jgi:hypothetical protein